MSRLARSVLITILAAACSTVLGCAGPVVYGSAPTIPRSSLAAGSLVYRPLLVPDQWLHEVSAGWDGGRAVAFDTGGVRWGSMDRHIALRLDRQFGGVMAETDGGARPTPTALVRFAVEDYREDVDRADEDLALCIIFGSITVGLLNIPCAGTRHDYTHRVTLSMTVHDVTSAPRERVLRESTGEFVMLYDTSATPSARRTYDVVVRSGVPAFGAPNGQAMEVMTREQGERIAEELLSQAVVELPDVMARLFASAPPVAPTVTAQEIAPPSAVPAP